MLRLRWYADMLIGVSATLASGGLCVIVAVILLDVAARSLGAPIAGARDLTQMTMVIVVFGGMALCDRNGGHISVDLLERTFSARFNRVVDAAAAILGAAIFFGIAWSVFDSSRISQMLNLSTNVINLPKAWFQWVLSVLALVTAVGMLLRSTELALGRPDVRHGEEARE